MRKVQATGMLLQCIGWAEFMGGDEDYPENPKKAIHWLKLAAKSGDIQSQCSLGVCYINGNGVRRNARTGARWYRKSAEQGEEWACYLLGLCYRDGLGVRRNSRWAIHWFGKAANLGVKKAKKAIKRMGA